MPLAKALALPGDPPRYGVCGVLLQWVEGPELHDDEEVLAQRGDQREYVDFLLDGSDVQGPVALEVICHFGAARRFRLTWVGGPALAGWHILGVRPGMSLETVESLLGPPWERAGSQWVYPNLRVYTEAGRVSGVRGPSVSKAQQMFHSGTGCRALPKLDVYYADGPTIYRVDELYLTVFHTENRISGFLLSLRPGRIVARPDPAPPPVLAHWRLDGLAPGLSRDEVVGLLGDPDAVFMPPTRARLVHYVPWWARYGQLQVHFADMEVCSVDNGRRLERDDVCLERDEPWPAVLSRLGPPDEQLDGLALYHDGELELHLWEEHGQLARMAYHRVSLRPSCEDEPESCPPSRPWLEGWAIGGLAPGMNREDLEQLGAPLLERSPHEAAAVRPWLAYAGCSVRLSDGGSVTEVCGSQLELLGGELVLAPHSTRAEVVARLGPPDWPRRPYSALGGYRNGPLELRVKYERDLAYEFVLTHRGPSSSFPPEPPEPTDEGPGSAVPRRPRPPVRTGRERATPPGRSGAAP